MASAAAAQSPALGLSDAALQQSIDRMEPGALVIAQRLDPVAMEAAAQRDRASLAFGAKLQTADPGPSEPSVASLMLRPELGVSRMDGSGRVGAGGILDSARDLECLTQAVYYEARGESPAGQQAVAQVVLNRVRHPAFPKTVCAVVFQGASVGHGCQFSFACDGSMHDRREPTAWRRAEGVAARALGGYIMREVGRSTHFHATSIGAPWEAGMIRVAQVGMHVFYRFGHPSAGAQVAADRVAPAATELATADTTPAAPQPLLASLVPTAQPHGGSDKTAQPATGGSPAQQDAPPKTEPGAA